MRKKGRIVALGGIVILFCLLYMYHDNLLEQILKNKQYYIMTLTESKHAEQSFWKNLEEQNKLQPETNKQMITLFAYRNNQYITNEEFERKEEVAIFPLYGYSTALFSDAYLLTPDDTTGCIMDAQTAWNLFGSMNVIGKKISYQQRDYIIRDVLVDRESFFAYEVSYLEKDEPVDLDMVAIALQEQQTLSILKTQLENTYQLQGQCYAIRWMRWIRVLLAHMAE